MTDPSNTPISVPSRAGPFGQLLLAGLICLVMTTPVLAEDNEEERRLQQIIGKINQRLKAKWKEEGVKPAPLASDAEFLRRAYLDVAGRIPSVFEAREFLADKSPNRREKLIKKLLDGHRYVTHFTHLWRDWMMPEVNSNFQTQYLAPQFEGWLRQKLMNGETYDGMVQELLTVSFSANPNQARLNVYGGSGASSPNAYYQGKAFKPENLAAATSRLFLGIRLECAQCHDHPFATWSREEFWEYAAFFAGFQSTGPNGVFQPGSEKLDVASMKIPDTDKTVQASYLGGGKAKLKKGETPRKALAEWMTSKKNPYFAKALVNRFWEYFTGHGFVEPIDQMAGTDNENSHPELLNELAQAFIDSGYDLKFLIRAITGSKVYQLSSRVTDKRQLDPTVFARMPIRGLSGEQLFDSVAQATGFRDPNGNAGVVFVGNNSIRGKFLQRFATQTGKRSEVQTSILQALAMMNGQLTATATSLKNSQTLAGILDSPFMDTRDRIEAIYLASVGRMPNAKERDKLVKYVEAGGSKANELKKPPRESEEAYQEALADVFWALLNSSEFMFNH